MPEAPADDASRNAGSAPAPRTRKRDPWRSRVTAIFWTLAGVFAISSSIQVAFQLFSPDQIPPPPTCAEGLETLASALDDGWNAARTEDDGPEAALGRFRAVVAPPWRALPGVQGICAGDARRAARLDALERLRYALEARVRVEGGSLAALRRRALEAPRMHVAD